MKDVRLIIPDQTNIQNFKVSVKVSEGLYKNKWIEFNFIIPDDWPFNPPRVTVVKDIFHPHVGEVKNGGAVSLLILQSSYEPSISIHYIVMGLQHTLCNISPNDAINIEAAKLLTQNYDEYVKEVNKYIKDFPND